MSFDALETIRKDRCYDSFKQYLLDAGFTVYPYEFDCISSKHPLVDIASKMGSFYWAFEYKSENDSISRGLEQVTCYSEWFDYVVLVSERYIDHTRSEIFWDLKSMGAGVWNYFPSSQKCISQLNPKLQSPNAWNKQSVRSRFRTLCGKASKNNNGEATDIGRQLFLCQFT